MAERQSNRSSSGKRDKRDGADKEKLSVHKGDHHQQNVHRRQSMEEPPDANSEQRRQSAQSVKDKPSAESCNTDHTEDSYKQKGIVTGFSKTTCNTRERVDQPDNFSKTFDPNRCNQMKDKMDAKTNNEEDRYNKMSIKIQQLEKDNKALSEQYTQMTNKMEANTKKEDDIYNKMSAEIQKLEKDKKALSEQCTQMKDKMEAKTKNEEDIYNKMSAEIQKLEKDKKALSEQCTQMKDKMEANTIKVEDRYNKMSAEIQKLEKDKKALSEQCTKMDAKTKKEEDRYNKMSAKIQKLEKENKRLSEQDEKMHDKLRMSEERVSYLQSEKDKIISQKQDLETEFKDLSDRFGRVASSKLIKDNPAVGNLSDPYRATNLADKYGKLYEETWTQMYRKMTKLKKDKEIVQFLLNILKEAFEFCHEMKKEQQKIMEINLLYPTWQTASPDKPVPRGPSKTLNEEQTDALQNVQKLIGLNAIEEVSQAFNDEQKKSDKHEPMYEPYYKKCIEFSWPAVLHRPPIVMVTNIQPGDDINRSMYNMRSTGDEVESLVWPPLKMGENILHKGVIEGRRTLSNKQASSDL